MIIDFKTFFLYLIRLTPKISQQLLVFLLTFQLEDGSHGIDFFRDYWTVRTVEKSLGPEDNKISIRGGMSGDSGVDFLLNIFDPMIALHINSRKFIFLQTLQYLFANQKIINKPGSFRKPITFN
jgi:hypothetical protein